MSTNTGRSLPENRSFEPLQRVGYTPRGKGVEGPTPDRGDGRRPPRGKAVKNRRGRAAVTGLWTPEKDDPMRVEMPLPPQGWEGRHVLPGAGKPAFADLSMPARSFDIRFWAA